jgi:hypothetical protein
MPLLSRSDWIRCLRLDHSQGRLRRCGKDAAANPLSSKTTADRFRHQQKSPAIAGLFLCPWESSISGIIGDV